jgi:tripeptidyl-peptidase-1
VSQPDVSAFGGYFAIVYYEEAVYAGTSVSAPLWAGFVSRMNEINIARKGATLGFINPLLYSMAAAQPNTFNDLKTGENFCPEFNTQCVDKLLHNVGSTNCAGFYSAPGWDPVTGLGSPNIGNMLEYLKTY